MVPGFYAPEKNSEVPVQGFEPWTIGLKVRPDLRITLPQDSCRMRLSASRLLAAPATAQAWLYKLAIHLMALSDRPSRVDGEMERPPPHLAPTGDCLTRS